MAVKVLMQISISLLIFVALMLLTFMITRLSKREMTKGTLTMVVILNIILSGLGGVLSGPITEGINLAAQKIIDAAESVYVENKYISLTPYNRGYFTGYMLRDKPQGKGTMVYLEDNEYRYTITMGSNVFKALRYEGSFNDGWRDGEGIVYYEGGYREVGTYYGQWGPNNIVFRGNIWDGDTRYCPAIIYSQNGVESWIDTGEGWIYVK